MADTLNSTLTFSAVDIYNGGGAAVAVLAYTGPVNTSLFFTPMLQLDNLNGAAADITVEVWLAYAKNDFFKFYTSGAVSKVPDASVKFIWTYPNGIIPFIKPTAVKVEIRVHSTNTNDTSVDGFAWLLNAKMNGPYLFETKVLSAPDNKTVNLMSVAGFQETNDWYINHLLEVEDADTGTCVIRRVVDQVGVQLILESDYPFTPATSDKARMLKTYYGDIGTVNGATPISTSDITTAMEASGRLLYALNALTEAAGDGDLAAMKTAVDIIDVNVEDIEDATVQDAAGENIAADIIALKAKADTVVADVWDEVLTGATHNDPTSAGRRLRAIEDITVLRDETAVSDGGGTNTIELDAGASDVVNFYAEDWIMLTSGTGIGQMRHIDSYDKDTKICMVGDDWNPAIDGNEKFVILARSSTHVHQIEQEGLDQIVAAMKAMTGITEGGTMTWETVMKIMTAFIAGNWRVKSGDSTKQELLDAENGTTVILEQSITRSPSAGNKYRDITVKI